jgi:hypothetical protein
MKQNLKIVSYIVRNLKKVSIFEKNSKPFCRFRRKSTKPLKKTPRSLTIILKVT